MNFFWREDAQLNIGQDRVDWLLSPSVIGVDMFRKVSYSSFFFSFCYMEGMASGNDCHEPN